MVYMYMPARYKRPSPYIEEPQRRITIPLTIGTYRNDPLTIQILKSPKRWVFKQKPTTKNTGNKICSKNPLPVCKWYRRRRALKQLQKLHKFEKAIPIHDKLDPQTALELYEKQQHTIENIRQEKLLKRQEKPRKLSRKERREHIRFESSNGPLDQEQYEKSRLKQERLKRERYDIDKFEKEYKRKNEKARLKQERKERKQYEEARLKQERKDQKRDEKERMKQERIELKRYKKEQKRLAREQANKNKVLARLSKKQEINYEGTSKKVSASPKADSKSVYAKGKKQRYKEPLSYRFTNCFYRFCCQLYCYFTFFLIIAIVIVIIIP